MTVEITLRRLNLSPDSPTYGVLMHKNTPLCVTLERPWLDNKPNVSCIPAGLYHCVPHSGEKFKDVWMLENVSGRSAILIHSGNRASDVQGCIAVGRAFFSGMITTSKETLQSLRETLPENFDLKIINP